MGFFSNLKNKITGGAASVTIQVPASLRRGQSAALNIQATAKADGKVAAVYVLVRGTESCEFKHEGDKVSSEHVSYENKIMISGPQDIKTGETYSWQGQIELPANVHPSL